MSSRIPEGRGYVLLDGARFVDAIAWLYQWHPEHEPWPLLHGTAYQTIAEAGPILLEAPVGSSVYLAWASANGIQDALWLRSDLSVSALHNLLQRRLKVFGPDHREYWLRLGDARPMHHAWRQGAVWPEGFWAGVDQVWLEHDRQITLAWENAAPEADVAPRALGLVTQVVLDWALLEALAQQPEANPEVAV